MIQLKLHIKKNTEKQRIGLLEVYKDDVFQHAFHTLERPWLNNKKNESGIKPDFYSILHYSSAKHPNTFQVLDVKDRTYILIHSGTYYTHTAGCIILGLSISDINNDGFVDVLHSREAMEILNKICKDEKIITLQYY